MLHPSNLTTFLASITLCILALLHPTRTLANLTPTPTTLWTGLLHPTTITYNPNNGLLYITTPTTLHLTAYDLTTLLTATTQPAAADPPASCGGWLYRTASVVNVRQTRLWTYDAYTLAVVGVYEVAWQSVVMGCAARGAVLLTARRFDTEVVALRATDGKRIAAWQLTNMSVQGVALSEKLGRLYVLDAMPGAVPVVQVFSYERHWHLYTLPTPNNTVSTTRIAVDPLSTYLFLTGQQRLQPYGFVGRLPIDGGSWQMVPLPFAAYGAYGVVLTASRLLLPYPQVTSSSVLVVDFARPGNSTSVLAGERPPLRSVQALTVNTASELFVATRVPRQVLRLDGWQGRLSGVYDLNNGTTCADSQRAAAVAVNGTLQLYASLCDGRIGVYNQTTQQLIDYILPYNYSASTSVRTLYVDQTRSQLYYTDRAHPTMIFRYDLTQRKVVQMWSNATANYDCFTVDELDQSIYACNSKPAYPTLDHLSANGTFLSATHLLNGAVPVLSLAISRPASQLVVSVSYSTVLGIDLRNGNISVTYRMAGAGYAGAVAADERTGRVYVMDQLSNGVLIFDGGRTESEETAVTGQQKMPTVVLRD